LDSVRKTDLLFHSGRLCSQANRWIFYLWDSSCGQYL